MPRRFRTLFFWTVILAACAPIFPSTQAAPRSAPPTEQPPTLVVIATAEASSDSLSNPKIIQTLQTPHIDQPPNPDAVTTVPPSNPQDCGYQWAYQDLPQLSGKFLHSIQALQAEAQAKAFAFGENCIHANGSATFLAMETDFNITLNVADLANESDLGEWIVNVMQIIEATPADQIVGPMPGRVTLIFQSGGEQKAINFHIDQYETLPAGLSNEQIFQSLQTQ